MAYVPHFQMNHLGKLVKPTPGTYVSNSRTSDTITLDHEGIPHTTPGGEIALDQGRRVVNLASQLVTHNVGTEIGRDYQVSCSGPAGSTVVLSDAATGTLTTDGVARQGFDAGVTATSATLTLTVTGPLTTLMVEDVTGRSSYAPSEYVEQTTDYGSGLAGTLWSDKTNGNSISGGVVTEAAGAALDPQPQVMMWPERTNISWPSDNLQSAQWDKNGVSIASSADLARPTNTGGAHSIANTNKAVIQNRHIVVSGQFESAGSRYLAILGSVATPFGAWAIFDLVLGTITARGADVPVEACGITFLGGGIFHCWVRMFTSLGSSMHIVYYIGTSPTLPGNGYYGNDIDGIYMRQLQTEYGSRPTPGIPAVSGDATREGCKLHITDFDTWFTPTTGLMLYAFTPRESWSTSQVDQYVYGGNGANLLYRDVGQDGLRTDDATTVAEVLESNTINVEVIAGVFYDATLGVMQLGYSKDAGVSWVWGSVPNITFTTLVADPELIISNLMSGPYTIRSLLMYDSLPPDTTDRESVETWIETNALSEVESPGKPPETGSNPLFHKVNLHKINTFRVKYTP